MSTQLSIPTMESLRCVQWMTPEWAAVELVERFFADLSTRDLVVEPSCGRGAFLKAIPDAVPAIGVEIDPSLAFEARKNTDREIICGDFCSVDLPSGVTAVIGNPPFQVATIERFLSRAQVLLPDLGRCGMLLPAYAMQTHNNVERWRQYWSLRAEIVPRRLFPRLRLPLVFVLFTRSATREMVGFCLYREAVEFDRMGETAKDVLINGRPRKGVWRSLVEVVLEQLGGEATLDEIYRAIEPRRPTPNAWWKEKVRQILQAHFRPVSRGVWRVPEQEEACI